MSRRSPRSRLRRLPSRSRSPRATTPTRRRSAAYLTAVAFVAAGCAAEDPAQRDAREEVIAHVRALGADSGYDADDVHCTDAAEIWFADRETNEFTCAVRLVEGGCDWFAVLVDRERRRVTVRLAQRDAGCTLGF